MNFFRY